MAEANDKDEWRRDKARFVISTLPNKPQPGANAERLAYGIEQALRRDEHWKRGALTTKQRQIVRNVLSLFASNHTADGATPINGDNVYAMLGLRKPHPNHPGGDIVPLILQMFFDGKWLLTAGLRTDLRHQQRERTIIELRGDLSGDGVEMRTLSPRLERHYRDWRLSPEFMREMNR